MKHTPGPWRVADTSYPSGYLDYEIRGPLYADKSSVLIAEMSDICERDDNARLIAAAPELLDSLQELHDEFKLGGVCLRGECQHETCIRTYQIFDRAGETIRKARGE